MTLPTAPIVGGPLDDLLVGSPESEKLQGKKGNDTLRGGKGDDTLQGGVGDDKLLGGKGNDFLTGGQGNDFITGGEGDDIIQGGVGIDTLRGGAGNDLFRVTAAEINGVDLFNAIFDGFANNSFNAFVKGLDVFQDFKSGEDKIKLGGVSGSDIDLFEFEGVTFFVFDKGFYAAKVTGVTASDLA